MTKRIVLEEAMPTPILAPKFGVFLSYNLADFTNLVDVWYSRPLVRFNNSTNRQML
ncbi:hypothetical protein N0Y54_22675 [Nostoc punctiforme UO1]|uniref:hypothetical protein n=1 Tax=Nostoc punctiforme TaxID=272131 RepID=UPI0030A2DAAC